MTTACLPNESANARSAAKAWFATGKGVSSGVVQAEPDITSKELAGALLEAEGVKANVSSLHRALKACGRTYKKRPDRVRA